jgi:hypothetical protein
MGPLTEIDAFTVEEIMADRKQAFRRWCFAKSCLVYRDYLVNLCGGDNQDEIELDGCLYASLDELFEAIDEDYVDEGLAEAVRLAWQAWLRSDEARI